MTRISNFRNNKYGAKKTTVDNITFDSKAEARRYQELKSLSMSGEIKWFQRQPSFLIGNSVRYRPDFIVCGKDGLIWLEDVKGHMTKDFIIKAKLLSEQYPTLELRIVR